MAIERFEDIDAWKKVRELTKMIYGLTRKPGFSKDWGLKDQITRASVSIMNNIAEGFDGGSNAEFVRFLGSSQRSATEVMSCLYVALDNQYISDDEFNNGNKTASKAKHLVGGFIKSAITGNQEPGTRYQEPETKNWRNAPTRNQTRSS